MPASSTAISLEGVTKRFGSITALDDVSLAVEEGEIYGFLGPNGAGKSTTIGTIFDFVRPTDGTVTVLGNDAQSEQMAVREHTGFLSDNFEVYDRLTGRQHVQFAIDSKGTDDDPDALLERVDLLDAADRKAGGYSKGMKQRLGLATTLVGEPDLLVLDEPSTGLDPNGAREMRQIITEENERGATVFFSSHILYQVEAVCDRVGILREGDLVAEDTIDGLRRAAGAESEFRIEVDEVPDGVLDEVLAIEGVTGASIEEGVIVVDSSPDAGRDILGAVEAAGATVEGFETTEASLEDTFAAYTEGAR